MHPDVAQPPGGADLRDSTAGRALRTLVAEGQEFLVGFVGPDLALGGLDPFLDLGQERIGDPAPIDRFRDRLARVAGSDVPGDRVVRAAGEFRGGAQRSRQIIRSKYFHDFSVKLH